MTTFTNSAPPRIASDPAKHVNYTYGMVLGVDDFTQEFTYLAAKDAQAAAEYEGYGRVRGLVASYSVPAAGQPRLLVSPGVAVVPGGQVVVVDRTQCAGLKDWITAHRPDVEKGLGGGAPHSGALSLVVVLRYATCDTDVRPIPGEPCRSEDDMMAPSRTRDDFDLVLRLPPPAPQDEVTAIGAFIAWLHKIPVTTTAAASLDDLREAIRTAAAIAGTPDAPEAPPIADFMAPAPPAGLEIPSGVADQWYRAAFALWAAELLPLWRVTPGTGGDGAGLTLAGVTLDVLYDPVSDTFSVDPAMPVVPGPVTQDGVPLLLGQQFMQELLLSIRPPTPPPEPRPEIVAAGWLDATGAAPAAPLFSFGGLTATARAAPDDDTYDLGFTAFDAAARYIVTGSPVIDPNAAGSHALEVAPPGAGGQPAIRIRRATAQPTNFTGFQVQIVRCP